ncbi:galanin receptor 2a-like [Bolinopsis microptera]|uniref:galanin receptor 2a-like n=1 Tax=Bolinopsis microptera TaxID=2820187 RepID=UPI003079BBA4
MVCTKEEKGDGCISYPTDIFLGVLVSLCCLVGSLENGFVLKILGKKVFNGREAKTRSKCTNTTYLLLCNLAIADLGNLLIPTPFNAFTLLYGRYAFSKKAETLKESVWYDFLINLVGWCSNLFVMVSMLLVCVIAVRRAVALYLPFKYNTYFKPLNIYILTVVSWAIAIAFACLPFYVKSTHSYIPEYGNSIAHLGKYGLLAGKGLGYYVTFLLIVTVIAVTIPALIIGIASFLVVLRLYTRKNIQYKVVKKKQKQSEENAARTVTIIPIIFFFCHLPVVYRITTSFIGAMYQVSNSTPPNFFYHSMSAKHYINMMFHFVLLTVNSCANPLVYLMGSKKLCSTAVQYIEHCCSMLSRPFSGKGNEEHICLDKTPCLDKSTKQTFAA